MAKTRAQRKAEKRAREAANEQQSQHDTQVPVSGDVAEFEAAEATGGELAAPTAPPPAQQPPAPPAKPQKPSRREAAEEKRRLKAQESERARKESERGRAPAPKEERQRGAVLSFLASSWAELKRVQWPDRETLIQASAVTLVFVAVAAAYLGALDAMFSFLIKRIL